MNAEKLMICVIDNGSALLLDRTLKSLKRQTQQSFLYEIADCGTFWTPDRNRLCPWADYVLFVYSGSRLEENAVAVIRDVMENAAPAWMYSDEKMYSVEINGDRFGVLEKPDFDPLHFAQQVYTGEGVVFSRAVLDSMKLQYKGGNFAAALMEMTIAAASREDGTHIRECLLTRHNRQALYPDEENLLGDALKAFLRAREPELLGIKGDGGLLLYPPEAKEKSLSVIVPSATGDDRLKFSGRGETLEVICRTQAMSYGENCLQAAREAGHEMLCFLDTGCVHPSGEALRTMMGYTCLPDAGFVSPCLYHGDSVLYAGAFGYAGKPFRWENTKEKELSRDLGIVRRTALPARQCWMISRELLLAVGAQLEKDPEVMGLSPGDWLMECTLHLQAMGRRNLYLGSVSLPCGETGEDSTDLCRMLYRGKEDYFLDHWCPASLRSRMRMGELKDVQAYFPEQLADPVPGGRKLFVLSHELSLTGAPIVLAQAVRILKEAGWQIVVASPTDGMLRREFLREGIPVLILGNMDRSSDWLRCVSGCDLVLVNTIVPFRQIEQLQGTGLPVLWWLHDAKSGYEDYLRHVLPETVGDNIHIFSVSQYADDAVKRYRPRYNTQLLLYGLKDEAPRVNAAAHPVGNGRKVFVSVGTVIKRKGQDILVRAIRLLPEDVRSRCLFLFIGKNIDESIFRQIKALEQEFPGDVRQIDMVPHDDIFNLYQQAAAVICSSRDDPLPTFMAETMMVSGVCICSENTGTAAVIEDGVNGYVYHRDDPRELADCIRRVAECGELDALRETSRKTFEDVFSMDVFRKNLLRSVELCLNPKEAVIDNE